MLVPCLIAYARQRLQLPPPMYQEQPIAWVIDLNGEGRCLGIVPTADLGNPATRRGARMMAPHLKRAYGIKPKLLADTGVYALGIPNEKDRPERVPQQREAFTGLVEACAEATGEPTVRAVAVFLRGAEAGLPVLPEGFDPGATLTFRVNGALPIDLPAVRAFWAGATGAGDDADGVADAGWMECIGCGERRAVLRRHPLKIKGIPGGQMSGTDLISANAAAFESYGLANSLIAPTCHACAEAYGNALNALLAGEDTSLRVGEMVFVFWTVEPTGFRPKRLLSAPDPTEVKELIAAASTGRLAALEIDETAFYALALSASGGRVVVRSWLETTVGEVRRRLGRWFALQDLVAWDGAPGEPLAVWRLAKATERTGGKDAPRAEVAAALLMAALGGGALPLSLLYQAVRRCRAEQGVSRERAALIKMVLRSRGLTRGGDGAMVELENENREPAYLCGRLLAVLEAIQRRALNNPNATIVDRYYGTASSAPASVFGTLLHGAQPHLSKMRKDPRSQGAQRALERRLEEVIAPLGGFPKTLTLQEQGLFALGFYHQRAADRRGAREHRATADEAEAATAATVVDDDEAAGSSAA